MSMVFSKSFDQILLCHLRSLISAQSGTRLSERMKKLNADGQFKEVIDLFEQVRREKSNQQLSTSIILEALKACTQMVDLQRGREIHRLVTSR
jgi:hypothetical protein